MFRWIIAVYSIRVQDDISFQNKHNVVLHNINTISILVFDTQNPPTLVTQ